MSFVGNGISKEELTFLLLVGRYHMWWEYVWSSFLLLADESVPWLSIDFYSLRNVNYSLTRDSVTHTFTSLGEYTQLKKFSLVFYAHFCKLYLYVFISLFNKSYWIYLSFVSSIYLLIAKCKHIENDIQR